MQYVPCSTYNSERDAHPPTPTPLPPAAILDAELPSLRPGRRLDPVTFSLACPTRLHSLIRLHSHLHLIRILCASTVAYACTHPAHWPGWLDIHRPAHIDRARRSRSTKPTDRGLGKGAQGGDPFCVDLHHHVSLVHCRGAAQCNHNCSQTSPYSSILCSPLLLSPPSPHQPRSNHSLRPLASTCPPTLLSGLAPFSIRHGFPAATQPSWAQPPQPPSRPRLR